MNPERNELVAGPRRRQPTAASPARRGSIYVFILFIVALVAAIGLSAVAVERARARSVSAQDDWQEAGLLAASAVEHALVTINATSNWRSLLPNNTPSTAIALGRGSYQYKLVDEIDGNLGDNLTQPVRLYGIGTVGRAVRMYSVQLPGSASPDVLATAIASSRDITCLGTLTLLGGPLFTSGRYTSGTSTNGNVEAASVVGGATVHGTITTPPPARSLPASSVYDTYVPLATDIPYASITSGTMNNKVLSAAANPYGSANAQAVYKVDVPAGGTLLIKNCRLVATLLVNLGAGATLTVSTANLWETPAGNYPILIVKSTASAAVSLSASASSLNEQNNSTNYNPPGTPYNGQSDTDTTDNYPSALNGFIHIIGASVSTSLSQITLGRTIFSEGPITLTSNVTITADPSLYTNPPMGYAPTTQVLPVTGAWRWEVLP